MYTGIVPSSRTGNRSSLGGRTIEETCGEAGDVGEEETGSESLKDGVQQGTGKE